MPTATKTAYALMWLDEGDDPDLNTLVYRPPSGAEVRTYYKGHLDARAGDESSFPRFDDKDDAWHFLVNNRGKKCLVAVPAAKKMYGVREKYAEPV